jgi:hypothetical protein
MALGMFWALNIVFAAVSAVLLAVLLVVYGRNAAAIKSKFTLGLVVFAALFLFQNVAGMWVYMSMGEAGMGPGVALPMLLLNVTETAALGTLFAITWS